MPKLSALTTNNSILDDDTRFYTVKDPLGTPIGGYTKWADMLAEMGADCTSFGSIVVNDTITITDGIDTSIIKHVQEPGLGGRLTFGLSETARTLVICDVGDIDTDFGEATYTEPTLNIRSAVGTNRTRIDYFNVNLRSGNTILESPGTYSRLKNYGLQGTIFFQYGQDIPEGDCFTFESDSNIELIDTDGEQSWLYIEPKINQSSTAAYNGLKIDVTETAAGDGSTGDGNNLVRLCVATNTKFRIDSTGGIFPVGIKSGTDQANAGAATGELWVDTSSGNVVKLGT